MPQSGKAVAVVTSVGAMLVTVGVAALLIRLDQQQAGRWIGIASFVVACIGVLVTYLALRPAPEPVTPAGPPPAEHLAAPHVSSSVKQQAPHSVADYLACLSKPAREVDPLLDPATAFLPLHSAATAGSPASRNALDALQRFITRDRSTRVVLVVGDYGGGKSFLVDRLMLEQLKACRADPRQRLPVLLPLRRFAGIDSPNGVLNCIVEHLQRYRYLPGGGVTQEQREHVRRRLADGDLLCLLDGFDELPAVHVDGSVTKLRKLLDALAVGDSKLVITSRTAAIPGVLRPEFARSYRNLVVHRLLPWEPARDWPAYLRMCVKQDVPFDPGLEALVAGREALFELTKTPLYCRMLVGSSDALGGAQEVDTAGLYRLYADRYLHSVYERDPIHEVMTEDESVEFKQDCLPLVAEVMLRRAGSRLTAAEITHAVTRLGEKYPRDALAQFGERATLIFSLLVPDAAERFEFSHYSFYEYYLAKKVHRELVDLRGRSPIAEHQRLPDAVIVFLAELFGSSRLPARAHDTLAGRRRATGAVGVLRRNLALLQLQRTDRLDGVNLQGLDFAGCVFGRPGRVRELRGVDFGTANLTGADLTGVLGADVSLRSATLTNAVLDHADLRGADLSRAMIHGLSCTGTHFGRLNLDLGDPVGARADRHRLIAVLWDESGNTAGNIGVDVDWLIATTERLR
jgi:hypothetical protein